MHDTKFRRDHKEERGKSLSLHVPTYLVPSPESTTINQRILYPSRHIPRMSIYKHIDYIDFPPKTWIIQTKTLSPNILELKYLYQRV